MEHDSAYPGDTDPEAMPASDEYHVSESHAGAYGVLAFLFILFLVWQGENIYHRLVPAFSRDTATLTEAQREESRLKALRAAESKHEQAVRVAKEKAAAKRAAEAKEHEKLLGKKEEVMGPRLTSAEREKGRASAVQRMAEQQLRQRAAAAERQAAAAQHSATPLSDHESDADIPELEAEGRGAASSPAVGKATPSASDTGTPATGRTGPGSTVPSTPSTAATVARAQAAPPTAAERQALAEQLAKVTKEIATLRLLPEPPKATASQGVEATSSPNADGAQGGGAAQPQVVTVVFRVHTWRGESRVERSFYDSDSVQAVLDAVHALCPDGLAGKVIAQVMPRKVVAGWEDYDLGATCTSVDKAESIKKAWEAARGSRAVPSTALGEARRTLTEAGLKGRVMLVVRLTDADKIY